MSQEDEETVEIVRRIYKRWNRSDGDLASWTCLTRRSRSAKRQ